MVAERRKTLPSPEVASGDIGLWSILRKNIGKYSEVTLCSVMIGCAVGKDLSKISMPVSLNEPLGALQVYRLVFCVRMCLTV